jgi:hypothetical protein
MCTVTFFAGWGIWVFFRIEHAMNTLLEYCTDFRMASRAIGRLGNRVTRPKM